MYSLLVGLEVLATWMRARLFITNYRPVPLTEHVVFEGKIYIKVGRSQNLQLKCRLSSGCHRQIGSWQAC